MTQVTLNNGSVDSAGSLVLKTNGTTAAVTIDTSQNVGIGTSSPAAKLDVRGSTGIAVRYSSGSGNGLNITQNDTTDTSSIINYYSGPMVFGTANTERARIDSSGNLLVGTTVSNGKFGVESTTNGKVIYGWYTPTSGFTDALFVSEFRGYAPNNATARYLYCGDNSSGRMIVYSNGGIANFSANNVNLSDARTKTDIVDAGNYLAKICAIPVRTFKYKDQTDDLLNLGCIAQEVEAIAPELVDVTGFGETPEDGIPLKAIYQTDLQYALMKCIQEQQAIITTQQTAIEQLRADVAELKAK